jgi:hypothetical protein
LPFEYNGLPSLRRPEIFTKILISSAEDAGLICGFQPIYDDKKVDAAYDFFQYYLFQMLSNKDYNADKLRKITTALAIYSISHFDVFGISKFLIDHDNLRGLYASVARRHPSEITALTFGLAISEIEAEWQQSPSLLIRSSARINLRAIKPADIRNAVLQITFARNKNLRANNQQFGPTFRSLLRLMEYLRLLRSHEKRS